MIGSVTQTCNMNTGCCFCRDSFRGEKCDECQIGYRDFPQVKIQMNPVLYCINVKCAYIFIQIKDRTLKHCD